MEMSNSFMELKNRIEDYKNRLNKNKKKEKILEGGVTSNSKVKFIINSINLFSKQTKNMSFYKILLSFDDTNKKEIEINSDNIRTKHKMY